LTHLKATIDSSKKQEAPRKETDQKLKKQKGVLGLQSFPVLGVFF
jgi:hypothetical protein